MTCGQQNINQTLLRCNPKEHGGRLSREIPLSPSAKAWSKLHANRLLKLQFYVVKLTRNHVCSDDQEIQMLKDKILKKQQVEALLWNRVHL